MTMSFVRSLLIILSLLNQTHLKPVLQPPSSAALEYMKRYGYLGGTGSDAENLYKEETIIDAIKTMQKFGGLEQTGIFDNDTVALFTTPRCGVPDVSHTSKNSNKTRTKRFIIGSEGWRKRSVTYYIANWSPKLGDRETESQLKKAFKIWGDYSGLKFTQKFDINADIILFFARGPHGDGYPMDGPGNILAHAFYPYEHGSYGGDVHFDEDENWVNGGSEDGFDFFTVAAHEIGHSLGLAHSHEPNSLMFPYYKGFRSDFQLGYDDILGVYQLYVSRPLQEEITPNTNDRSDSEEHEEHDNERDDERDAESDEREDEHDDDIDDERDGYDETETNDENTSDSSSGIGDEDIDHDDNSVQIDSEEESTTPSTPNICEGSYDTITTIRGELFVFRDEWVWRFKDTGLLDENYPVKFQQLFRFPQPVKRIDAAYERHTDNKIVLFSGPQYWLFDGNAITSPNPAPLSNLSLPEDLEKLDAALIWGKNFKTYFFHGDQYWRYDDTTRTMEDGYPKPITNWKRIPYPINSAFQWTDGKTYFFVDKDFYRFNDQEVIADEQYPLPAYGYWFGC